jgi:hypothetical protein
MSPTREPAAKVAAGEKTAMRAARVAIVAGAGGGGVIWRASCLGLRTNVVAVLSAARTAVLLAAGIAGLLATRVAGLLAARAAIAAPEAGAAATGSQNAGCGSEREELEACFHGCPSSEHRSDPAAIFS